MKIAVIDGQGGGIGKHITEKLRRAIGEDSEIIALGTNALATAAMVKAGANDGATGENAIVCTAARVDVIVGPISVLLANSMYGEVTPKMVCAIGGSDAKKIFLPLNRNNVEIVGASSEPLPHQIDRIVEIIQKEGGKRHV